MPPLSEPVFQILLSLVDADLHGYAIILDIRQRTEGRLQLTASTLYAALSRLLADGSIEEVTAPADNTDERRRYYHLTADGRAIAQREAERLAALTTMARAKRLLLRKA
ncbi:MAG: helix-turn-helix transcriptional regulator [Vicinamibacteria bacterium]